MDYAQSPEQESRRTMQPPRQATELGTERADQQQMQRRVSMIRVGPAGERDVDIRMEPRCETDGVALLGVGAGMAYGVGLLVVIEAARQALFGSGEEIPVLITTNWCLVCTLMLIPPAVACVIRPMAAWAVVFGEPAAVIPRSGDPEEKEGEQATPTP